MKEYPIGPEFPHFLRLIEEIIDGIANQAINYPYRAAISSAVIVAAAAKGFGMPRPVYVGLGVGTFFFTAKGLRRKR